MSKIEEIIAKYNYNIDSFLSVECMMRDYAEWYAKKCLEIAVDNAETYTDRGGYTFVDGKSILNIKLPDHDKTL